MAIVLTAALGFGASAQAQNEQQPALPDSPKPQTTQPFGGMPTGFTPDKGADEKASSSTPASDQSQPPAASAPSAVPPADTVQTEAPEIPAPGEGFDKTAMILHVNVNFVEVPVTVKDSKGKLVAGLTYHDFQIYENGRREPLRLFTTDSFPLSVAFIIDQSLTSDVMGKVNQSLGAIQGALTPYDEAAVFTYANGPQERTGFTGAQSKRLPAVLALAKSTGTEIVAPITGGPFSSACSISKNGGCVDPNVQRGGSAGSGTWVAPEKEIHTLNDAILAAAKELSTRPKGRRRIIYVISDGKESGSKAKYKDVKDYLDANKIAVWGTLVGDSARWGEGYLSRIHIPGTMRDNILAKYAFDTGGVLDAERGPNGIEKSYAKIAEEARTQYTLGYLSHQPFIDGKYRSIEVRVSRPGMEIIAKKGYKPSAQDLK
jgi:VWFA-related protein